MLSHTIWSKINTFLFSKKAVLFIIILFSYIIFPTNNSSLDAYAYAGYVKYNSDLFTPHHILSHAFIYILMYPIKAIGLTIDGLLFGKIINGLFHVINLYIFYKILVQLNIKYKLRLLYVLVIAFSFNLWQYCTENETYIIPITFSLLGSLYFLKSMQNKKTSYIIVSGLFTATACLFHQLHFFWWLGLLIGFFVYFRSLKVFLLYAFSALLVPIVYAFVLIFYENQVLSISNLYYFMMHDFYQKGIADVSYSWHGWKSLLFQAVNTVRIFFQAHPNVYVLLKTHWLYFIPLVGSLFIGFKLLWQFLKHKNVFKRRKNDYKLFANIHGAIFIAVYLFAFYSYGNIEFLVSVPFVLFIFLSIKFEIDQKFLKQFIVLLFIWNFSFGVFPDNYYTFYNDGKLVDYIIENPDKTFLVKNPDIENQYFYKTGIGSAPNVLYYHKITNNSLVEILKNKEIYTDVIEKPEVFNRTKIDAIGSDALIFSTYQKEKIFSYKGLYGVSVIYKVSSK